RIVFSEDARDFARAEWTALVDSDPAATFFHRPKYLKLYWEEFGEEAELLLAFGEEDGRTIGACAFELHDDRLLRFLGGTEVTDYMGPVAAPGFEDAFAKELMGALRERADWSTADLRGLAEDSPWLPRLADAAGSLGFEVEPGLDAVAPFLAVPPTWDEYLAGLPGKLRHEIKRKARRLDAEVGEHRLVFASPETLEADLGLFAEMHRTSEGPKGHFMVPGMELFFRRLGDLFIPEGEFHLAFLETGGQRPAGAIAFRFRGVFYLYNSAFDRSMRDLAPGMVLVADLIEHAIHDGCGSFDLLKGDLEYKYRFGSVRREVRRLGIARG
ncbi:MAG TPA: GNAT family N-acetyltransferase, partial [Actinomycetota bacterium]|nr:GNAT family N-acetyltransferase [Actinomycetota bacterium]